MKLELKWHLPQKLLDGSKNGLIYEIYGLDKWYDISGVYMFCRKYGKSVVPLYIGQALDIGSRIKQHLNSVKLMKGIKDSLSGDKILIVGQFIAKPGQDRKKSISIIEKALIAHCLVEGIELLNKQGTKTKFHEVSISGYLFARNITGKSIFTKT
jgi:hypothetical protein